MENKIISIIITTWAMDEERSAVMRSSLNSLFLTIKNCPVELIIVDNGENIGDSEFLLKLCDQGKINTYIRNSKNMHFAYARNQALRICNGDYIVIADNDIYYNEGWLEKCIAILDQNPDEKIYATPLYNVAHWLPKYWNEKELKVDGKRVRLNARAGSNCFVIRRKDLETVGEFLIHRVAGTKWTEEAIEKGYMAAITPTIMVKDLQFRRGYNLNDPKPIKEILSNGKEVYFNDDEYRKDHFGLHYSQQKRFNPKPNIRFIRACEK